VIEIGKGVFPVLMAASALPVAMVIGITVPETAFVTLSDAEEPRAGQGGKT
jgi:hypothetical protein